MCYITHQGVAARRFEVPLQKDIASRYFNNLPPHLRNFSDFKYFSNDCFNPLARCQAPAEGRRPESEGAYLDRQLVR